MAVFERVDEAPEPARTRLADGVAHWATPVTSRFKIPATFEENFRAAWRKP